MSGQNTAEAGRKKRKSVWKIFRRILTFFVATASMAVLYYVIFALIFSTDEEKRLKDENRAYEREFPLLEEKESLVSEVVEGLRIKDDRIYEAIFHTSAPNVDPLTNVDFFAGVDSIADNDIVIYAEKKIVNAEKSARNVEENFTGIMRMVSDSGFVMPPMTNPMRDF